MQQDQKHIVSFSGGKDSTALILWAREYLSTFDTVWMDTGWEHPLTYAYVDYIDRKLLGSTLIRLSSSKYDGFEDLAVSKGRVPSTKARFCTQKLKLEPLREYFDTLRSDFEIHNYVGIRAQESFSRSQMPVKNFDLDYLGCWIHRPLLEWSADDVFNLMSEHEVDPNPLYAMGMKRVGCMPCIMANHTDMRQIIKRFPEIIEAVRAIEEKIGRSFFPPGYIPARYCSRFVEQEVEYTDEVDDMFGKESITHTKHKVSWYPMIDDVVRYLSENPNQLSIEDREPQSCLSHYNICE